MVERLNALGIDLTVDDVLAASTDAAAAGRPHVADALVTRGVVGNRDEAFERYLGWGRPAYVGRYQIDLLTAIRLVREAGGVSVLAHPWGRGGFRSLAESDLAGLQERGLTGIEVDHQDHDPDRRAALRSMAANLGLVATGSSDYHGAGKIDHDLGVNTTAPDQLDRLLQAAAVASAASGRVTPAYVEARA
jgi:predicted metal-dependent phosphoesterase TrpH